MNEVKISLTRSDIEIAIGLYLKEKYPNFVLKSLKIEYNRSNTRGIAIGKLK